ncbi:hypothetical protein VKT23_006348 [Stygiomarasmius scandens]|uniref:MULE transposase domain-containing protein n=1 Tax=Marasmiellus scandens TaxID=2682957 RepID=A0ABR1JNV5_9AGAR
MPGEDDRDFRNKLRVPWSKEYETNGRKKGGEKKWVRVDRHFHCAGGIDHTQGPQVAKKRQIPWPDVGCNCWIHVVSLHDNTKEDKPLLAIWEISGILEHSIACEELTEMEKDPIIPLHPCLREHALSLLHKPGYSLRLLRNECAEWAKINLGDGPGDTCHRWQLRPHDTSSLYCSIARENGIPQRSIADDNLDRWFRAEKPQPPSMLLTESCLHYQPFDGTENGRFEIIIQTPTQRAQAWKHGHKQHILMDLTFGFCNARTLLVNIIAMDDEKKAVPIGHMIFTARKSAKAVHADYNTAVLDHLQKKFKAGMGKNEAGEEFDAKVASTDNDTRERTSLSINYLHIFLLLCIFHIWQAWRNGLNKYLAPIPKGIHWQEIRTRLGKFLHRQINDIYDYSVALESYNAEVRYFQDLKKQRKAVCKTQGNAGLAFLGYLRSYLDSQDYWLSWSAAGAQKAADILGLPVEQIPRTTNPVENFNRHIKSTYFEPYMHSGRLPRIDTWILVLITRVLPDFFTRREQERSMRNHYSNNRMAMPGQTKAASTSESKIPPSTASSSSSSGSSPESDTSRINKWLDALLDEDPEPLALHSDSHECQTAFIRSSEVPEATLFELPSEKVVSVSDAVSSDSDSDLFTPSYHSSELHLPLINSPFSKPVQLTPPSPTILPSLELFDRSIIPETPPPSPNDSLSFDDQALDASQILPDLILDSLPGPIKCVMPPSILFSNIPTSPAQSSLITTNRMRWQRARDEIMAASKEMLTLDPSSKLMLSSYINELNQQFTSFLQIDAENFIPQSPLFPLSGTVDDKDIELKQEISRSPQRSNRTRGRSAFSPYAKEKRHECYGIRG